jgi:hypothetical protein
VCKIGFMTLARRLSAATMALMLATFPVALERCRTACVTVGTPTPQSAPSAHACHDAAASDDGSGARLDPLPRACGHGDEARTRESVSLVAGKAQRFVPVQAVVPVPQDLQVRIPSRHSNWPPGRAALSPVLLSLNSPLRL